MSPEPIPAQQRRDEIIARELQVLTGEVKPETRFKQQERFAYQLCERECPERLKELDLAKKRGHRNAIFTYFASRGGAKAFRELEKERAFGDITIEILMSKLKEKT